MLRIGLGLFCFLRLTLLLDAARPLDAVLPAEERRSLQREALLVIELLQGLHYSDRPFSELDAHEFLDRYLDELDADHLILTAAEVDFIHHRFDRNLKPVYLFKGDLHPAFEIFDLFAERAAARCEWIDRRLGQPFDLGTDARQAVDRRKAARPATAADAEALWERWLRLQIIGEMLDGRNEPAAVDAVRASYLEYRKSIVQIDPLAVRERFLNSLLESFDPHSGYFSRDSARQFEVQMSGAVVGIGVELRGNHGRFFVDSVQPGGPADRCARISPGDEVISVAEAGAPPVMTAGRRLSELVELIGGAVNTPVTLGLRPQGTDQTISLTLNRARVEIASDHAQGAVVTVPGPDRARLIGLLTLPSFYGTSGEGASPASVSRDARELLTQFAARRVEAVVIDLRGNRGGLLPEAVQLTGLFQRGGPAALLRGLNGKVDEMRADNSTVDFTGPLVVLISHVSASASEAFAGALQCYRRAIIAGAATTFGKGTSQDFVDLRKLSPGPTAARDNWGTARVTRQFFYLPDGRSPQRSGVAADIVLSGFPESAPTEKDLPHALPPEAVASHLPAEPAAGTARVTPELLADLRAASRARQESLPEFALQRRAIAWHARRSAPAELSLQLDLRRRERADEDAARQALFMEGRALTETQAYAVTAVDLPLVAENNRVHQAALRSRTLADGSTCLNRFCWNVFYYQPRPDEAAREIRIDSLDFEGAEAIREPLAQAWSQASGHPLSLDQVATILSDLSRRRGNIVDPPDYPAIFRRQTGAEIDPHALAAGMDAFFRTAIEFDREARHDGLGLDIPLRESLRIAADWAARSATGREVSPTPPTTVAESTPGPPARTNPTAPASMPAPTDR